MRIKSPLLAAAASAFAATAVATAAPTPDQTVTLSSATTEFNWDGAQGQHFDTSYEVADCSKDADNYCEIFLLDVRSGGPVTLDASLTEFSNPLADFDLRVYKPDEEGTAPGEQVDSPDFTMNPTGPSWGGPNGVDEFFHAENLPPGKYWLVAHHFINPDASYKGNVKVTGATPVAGTTPPPSGGATPPSGGGNTPAPPPGSGPAALPLKLPASLGSARKASRRKSLSFKATAGQDITNLTITLLNSKKKAVAKTRIASFPKGSKTVKLKVRKLKAGSYQLAAEGTVNGQRQGIVRAVKIRK